ncbi:YunC family protein [Candidatus Ruminimicrobiellum ovillum]|uniref:YunC family protein n=1 Tax=Candidatus Ruminimicrobiellum ovillum TaxID=1947927 RepID=UPI0035599E0D
MVTKEIKVNNTVFKGVELPLCNNANLLVITGEKGYIMCGYLNINTAQKRNDVACIVTGVKTIEDMLNSKVVALTAQAQKLGISMNMEVKKVLEVLAK